MAYDASREKQIDFGIVSKNKRGDCIKIQRIVPLDRGRIESIDVRNMYTADDDELYPAKQGGLRMNSEIVVDVMAKVYSAMSAEERIDFRDAIDELDNESEIGDSIGEEEYTEQDDD